MKKDLKTVSKESYALAHDGNPTLDEVNTSCLIRIADAIEIMAKNYAQMQSELERLKKNFQLRGIRIGELERSNSSLRGVITRLKNKLAVKNEKEKVL